MLIEPYNYKVAKYADLVLISYSYQYRKQLFCFIIIIISEDHKKGE